MFFLAVLANRIFLFSGKSQFSAPQAMDRLAADRSSDGDESSEDDEAGLR